MDDLIGLSVLIDIHQKALSNSDYQLMPSDIEDWEGKHGNDPGGRNFVSVHGVGEILLRQKEISGNATHWKRIQYALSR